MPTWPRFISSSSSMALRRRVGRPFPNALIACHDGPGEAALGSVESVRSHGTGVGAPARQTPRFTITRVAELVGRTSAAIRDAEKEGRLPSVEHTASGRRMGYALGEINQMRAVFGTRPWRTAGDPLSVIAVQNFKGSVGKSTVASHLATARQQSWPVSDTEDGRFGRLQSGHSPVVGGPNRAARISVVSGRCVCAGSVGSSISQRGPTCPDAPPPTSR